MKYVNRDNNGYVDFEKMRGIVGIAMANVISNIDEVNMKMKKKIKSKITFDDGKLSKNSFLCFFFALYCFPFLIDVIFCNIRKHMELFEPP